MATAQRHPSAAPPVPEDTLGGLPLQTSYGPEDWEGTDLGSHVGAPGR